MDPSHSSSSLRPSRGRLLGFVIVMANLAVLATGWVGLRMDHRQREAQALATARNLTQVLERNLDGEIRRVEFALSLLKQEIEGKGAQGGPAFPGIEDSIRALFAQLPALDSLRVADAEGWIRHGIGVPATVPPQSIADRDYFHVLRDNPEVGLQISKPLLGRISGKWVIILARGLRGGDGRFGGVVYGVVTLDAFTRSLTLVDPGANGTVSLRDGEGGLIARYSRVPSPPFPIGDRTVAAPFVGLLQAKVPSGQFVAKSAVDGLTRSFALQRVGGHPLYLTVGLAEVDYLAGWRREVWQVTGLCALFGAGSLLFGIWIRRSMKRDAARIRDLRRALDEVDALQDFLPICMYCKKVRDDQNYWSQLEHYLHEHAGTVFSHGICPECRDRLMADLNADRPAQG